MIINKKSSSLTNFDNPERRSAEFSFFSQLIIKKKSAQGLVLRKTLLFEKLE